jgi:hypothetical protein
MSNANERPAKKMRMDNEDVEKSNTLTPYYQQYTVQHGKHTTTVTVSFESEEQFKKETKDYTAIWTPIMIACNRKNGFKDEKGEGYNGEYCGRSIESEKKCEGTPEKVEVKMYFRDEWQGIGYILRIKRNGEYNDEDEYDEDYDDEEPAEDIGSQDGDSDTEDEDDEDEDEEEDDE